MKIYRSNFDSKSKYLPFTARSSCLGHTFLFYAKIPEDNLDVDKGNYSKILRGSSVNQDLGGGRLRNFVSLGLPLTQ